MPCRFQYTIRCSSTHPAVIVIWLFSWFGIISPCKRSSRDDLGRVLRLKVLQLDL